MFLNIIIIKQSSVIHKNYIIMFYDFRSRKTQLSFPESSCYELTRPSRSSTKFIKYTEATDGSE